MDGSASCAPGAVVERGPRIELADIVRAHGAAYRRTHVLSRPPRRALRAIASCRTAVLGGHRAVCAACGAARITYNSCRNRHCPKCQRVATERWLAARRREVLPIPYFHVVFTLPHTLNPLAQSHPRLLYRSCSTSCPTASSASATSACSPTAAERRRSRSAASS